MPDLQGILGNICLSRLAAAANTLRTLNRMHS